MSPRPHRTPGAAAQPRRIRCARPWPGRRRRHWPPTASPSARSGARSAASPPGPARPAGGHPRHSAAPAAPAYPTAANHKIIFSQRSRTGPAPARSEIPPGQSGLPRTAKGTEARRPRQPRRSCAELFLERPGDADTGDRLVQRVAAQAVAQHHRRHPAQAAGEARCTSATRRGRATAATNQRMQPVAPSATAPPQLQHAHCTRPRHPPPRPCSRRRASSRSSNRRPAEPPPPTTSRGCRSRPAPPPQVAKRSIICAHNRSSRLPSPSTSAAAASTSSPTTPPSRNVQATRAPSFPAGTITETSWSCSSPARTPCTVSAQFSDDDVSSLSCRPTTGICMDRLAASRCRLIRQHVWGGTSFGC